MAIIAFLAEAPTTVPIVPKTEKKGKRGIKGALQIREEEL